MELLFKEVPWRFVEEWLHFCEYDLEAARVGLLKHFTSFDEGIPAASILFTLDRLDHLHEAEGRIEKEFEFDAWHALIELRTFFLEVESKTRLPPDRLEPTTCGHFFEHVRESASVKPVIVADKILLVWQQIFADLWISQFF